MYKIAVAKHFDAAHHIIGYQGDCSRQHGHRFSVQVTIEGKELDSKGMLTDFKLVKDILEEKVLDKFDHYDLNEIPPFNEGYNPTAENIAKYIYGKLKGIIGLSTVRVYESPEAYAEYWE